MFNSTNRIRKRLQSWAKRHDSKKAKTEVNQEVNEEKPIEKIVAPTNNLVKEKPKPVKPHLKDIDIINIYKDLRKLSDIEQYLNLLYRPFTCSVRTKCELSLYELSAYLPNVYYEPEKYSALIIRRTNPLCCLKVFENGIISCQGYSYDSAELAIRRFLATIQQFGYPARFLSPRFNVVNATFSVPFSLDLDQIYDEYYRECLYFPELQPYLTFKLHKSTIRLAIFAEGYVFVMLSTQSRFTEKAIAYILPILYRHKAIESETSEYHKMDEIYCGDISFKILWEREFQEIYQNQFIF